MFWAKVTSDKPSAVDMNRNLGVLEAPDSSIMLASVISIFVQKLGFTASLETGRKVLGDGRVIPMMSYGLVEYLMGVDLSHFDILEIGGGDSTTFWSGKAKSVLTLETDPAWVENLRQRRLPKVEVRHVPELVPGMMGLGRGFDAVIVDPASNRYAAAKAGLARLNPGGFILLDNSDWYPNTTAMLRKADLIQVDFPDFRPGRWFRCTTSLFLHKDFRARPIPGKALPQPPIGGKDIAPVNDWDRVTD